MTNRFSYCPFMATASRRDPDEERNEEKTAERIYVKKEEKPED